MTMSVVFYWNFTSNLIKKTPLEVNDFLPSVKVKESHHPLNKTDLTDDDREFRVVFSCFFGRKCIDDSSLDVTQ